MSGQISKKELDITLNKLIDKLGSETDVAIPVSRGGTGATNESEARTNLGITPANIGAASSSHTHNYAGSSSAGGSATSAVKLATARTIRTNLASTSTASFDGSANITPGVTGTLLIANGGTGAATAAAALDNLGGMRNYATEGYSIVTHYNGKAGTYGASIGISASAGVKSFSIGEYSTSYSKGGLASSWSTTGSNNIIHSKKIENGKIYTEFTDFDNDNDTILTKLKVGDTLITCDMRYNNTIPMEITITAIDRTNKTIQTDSSLNDTHRRWFIAKDMNTDTNCAIAFGQKCLSTGYASSFACGYMTTASGNYGSFASGCETIASYQYAHAEGHSSKATGTAAHAEGEATIAEGSNSHSEGQVSRATGHAAHAEGYNTTASGSFSHAEGYNTTASGSYSHAEGNNNTASGSYSHVEGFNTTAIGRHSHTEGNNTTASADSAHAEGIFTEASGAYSHAQNFYTIADKDYQTAMGRCNKSSVGLLIVGKGTNDSNRANCFRVLDTAVYATGNYNSTGADYAEYFEWEDGNPNNEDRRGLFVSLNGDKISISNGNDNEFILGIISGNPSVIGDSHEDQWNGMYMYDIYGTPIMEEVEIPERKELVKNEDGTEEEVILEPAHTEIRQKLNPNYNSNEPYIPRSERKEWDVVGMLGKLVLIDDGSCIVNEYVKSTDGGIGTYSDSVTRYRMMSRIDESHIRVLVI